MELHKEKYTEKIKTYGLNKTQLKSFELAWKKAFRNLDRKHMNELMDLVTHLATSPVDPYLSSIKIDKRLLKDLNDYKSLFLIAHAHEYTKYGEGALRTYILKFKAFPKLLKTTQQTKAIMS